MVSMRAKRCMWLLGGLVALCVCAAWLYQSAYPIALDRSNAAECIQDFYLHGSTAEPPVVKLYDAVTLGDRTYVLLELGENLDLGRAILERSLTGRYRVAGLGYGGGSFRDEIVEIPAAGRKKHRRADHLRHVHLGRDRLSDRDPTSVSFPGLHGGGQPDRGQPSGFGNPDLVQCSGKGSRCRLHTTHQREARDYSEETSGSIQWMLPLSHGIV